MFTITSLVCFYILFKQNKSPPTALEWQSIIGSSTLERRRPPKFRAKWPSTFPLTASYPARYSQGAQGPVKVMYARHFGVRSSLSLPTAAKCAPYYIVDVFENSPRRDFGCVWAQRAEVHAG